LKENKYYKYRGARNLENLYQFIEEGYLNSESENMGDIPKRLEGISKIAKHGSEFLSELARAVDLGFEKMGLKFIPKTLRYIFCLAFVFSPIIAVCYILIFEEDEDLIKARRRIAE
jgi:hypothetical protein